MSRAPRRPTSTQPASHAVLPRADRAPLQERTAPAFAATTATRRMRPLHLPSTRTVDSRLDATLRGDSCSAVQPRRGRPDRRRKRLQNDYEILLMLDPELPEERQNEIVARTREPVERGGGTWVRED